MSARFTPLRSPWGWAGLSAAPACRPGKDPEPGQWSRRRGLSSGEGARGWAALELEWHPGPRGSSACPLAQPGKPTSDVASLLPALPQGLLQARFRPPSPPFCRQEPRKPGSPGRCGSSRTGGRVWLPRRWRRQRRAALSPEEGTHKASLTESPLGRAVLAGPWAGMAADTHVTSHHEG